jgi:hypothetical protein
LDASPAVAEETEIPSLPKTGIPSVDAPATDADAAPTEETVDAEAAPWVAAPPAAAAAAAVPSVPSPLYDPVSAAITSLMQSEGELAPTEMRRLDLYRPDRILQVVEEHKMQAGGRQRAARLSRLEAIERYALALSSAPPIPRAPSPAVEALTPTEAPPAEETVSETESLVVEHDSQAIDEDFAIEAETTEDPTVYAPQTTELEESPIEGVETNIESEPIPEDEPLITLEEEIVESEIEAAPEHPAPVIGEAWFEEPRPAEQVSEDIPSAGESEEEFQVQEAVPDDEDTAEFESALETVEDQEPQIEENAALAEVQTPTGFLTRPGLESLIGERPIMETEPPAELPPLNANDIIALPPRELIGSLPRLDATELGKVFVQAETPEIKRHIIARLGDLRTPEALLVLQSCLDDPDPDIQAHALETADRLLADNS